MAIDKKYESIVKNSAKAAATAGVSGAINPFLDTAAVAGIWTNMIIKIAQASGHQMSVATATKFVTTVASGVAAYKVGSKLFSTIIWLIPGIGWLGAMGVNSTLNYLFTYKLGKVTSGLFGKPGFDYGSAVDVATYVVLPMLSIPTLREFREMV